MRYRYQCWKARFVGTWITDAETGWRIMFKVWRTTGMTKIPRRGDIFRVGSYVGDCILSTPWFVVMRYCDEIS